ncbi:MAG: tetratricopeptide repeat protein [Pseudomonadota bacterium]|nr:tetratricopeptide repeat protein [Pseudomonadota bacterium]
MRKISCVFLLLFFLVSVSACGGPEEKKMKFYNRGMSLYEQGDYVKATLEFKNALQVDQKFARAYQMLGMTYLKQNDFRNAYGTLHKAVELNADLLEAQVNLGKLLMLGRKPDEAMEKAELVLRREPDNQEALNLKAACLLADKQEVEAKKILESLVQKDTRLADPYLLLARLQLKNEDFAGAKKLLKQLLAFNPKHRQARLLLVGILEQQQDLEAAEQELKAMIAGDPEPDKVRMMLVKFYNQHGRDKEAENVLLGLVAAHPDLGEYRLLLVNYYADKRQEEKMLTELKKARTDLPQNYDVCEMLAQYYVTRRQVDKAVKLLTGYMDTVRTGPDFLKAKLFMAAIDFQEQQQDEALKLVDEVLSENSADIKAHELKGDMLAAKKDFTGATGEYRVVLDQTSDNYQVRLKLARVHLANKEPNLAKDVLKKTLELNPRFLQAGMVLASIYRQEEKNQLALEQLEKVLAVNPDVVPALEQIVDIMFREKKSGDKILSRIEQQRTKRPKNPLYQVLLARFYIISNQLNKARQHLQTALALDPENQPAIFALARLEQLEGSLEAAIARYEGLRKKNPNHPGLAMITASLYEKQGKPEKAGAIYRQVLTKNPQSMVAANNLAFYYAEYDPTPENLQEALELIAPLIERYAREPVVVDSAAWVYYKLGEYARARDLLLGVKDKLDKIPIGQYHLGMAFLKLNDSEQAKEWLAKSVSSKEEFSGREHALKLLKTL